MTDIFATKGVRPGDPSNIGDDTAPWPPGTRLCPSAAGSYGCTAAEGHTGPHMGEGMRYVLATWEDDSENYEEWKGY